MIIRQGWVAVHLESKKPETEEKKRPPTWTNQTSPTLKAEAFQAPGSHLLLEVVVSISERRAGATDHTLIASNPQVQAPKMTTL